ncbi:LysR substrate-binding domain-containing protein [Nitratireductor indicus]|uniref:Transcriptional regulator n=1 Tax=Nitratireductor indicus C115 TaxID=1231190 RepID=K2PI99_9HYPH|nr:LysR substrate-binding domain-containing protein [Nitratireductor indicus]EKF40887.1 transcriptional regulator [Nitratireductor indicus C115]MDS1138629.1 LysR substrate-binding domain-containing protein [Nitratireductor indicus]SFQ33116.1 DNA-binding transcriptional regulator, LysR family [Nitratireductor indicus]
MAAPLDLDQLSTFIAIADTGSFTRAAEEVHRTQSAVSMQMRRLEERVGKTLFLKDGRTNRLTEDGERLLGYARRLLRLNRETLAAFDDASLEGHIRIGTPDDYADRFLPEIMGRFSRSNPRVELSILCEPTLNLVEHIRRGSLDLALVTYDDAKGGSEAVRREPVLWVCSANHPLHERDVLPMAFGRPSCQWRRDACIALEQMQREYRVLFTSFSATVITSAVLAGLAISVLPECALRPGMRVLGEADGFAPLPDCRIGLMRGHSGQTEIIDALARHISESLDNLSVPAFIEETGNIDFNSGFHNIKGRRLKPGHVMAGW